MRDDVSFYDTEGLDETTPFSASFTPTTGPSADLDTAELAGNPPMEADDTYPEAFSFPHLSDPQETPMTSAFANDFAEQPNDAFTWVTLIRDTRDTYTRNLLIEDFHRWANPVIRRTSVGILRKLGLDRNTFYDDIESRTAEALFRLLIEVVEGKLDPTSLISFEALLGFRAMSLAKDWRDSSGGLNVASGQKTLKRRIKEMQWTITTFTQQVGRLPSAEEVVEETNRRLEQRIPNYERQGMRCTLDDYRQMELGTAASIDAVPEQAIADPNDSDSPLHSADRDRFIRTAIARCAEESEILGKVAEIWFNPATQEHYDGHPTSADIAPLLGIAPQTARTKIARVKQVARDVLRESYDIEDY